MNCLRIMVNEGLFELTYGHMSCRGPQDPSQFLILEHLHEKGQHISEVTANDIVEMGADGETYEGSSGAPGERFIHTEIYRQRVDVQAVVHCHPRIATAFSIAGVNILPVDHLGLLFAPQVAIHDYSGQIDSAQRGAEVAASLGSSTALLLRSHGVVVTGSSIEKACLATLALERTAQTQMLATQIGGARPVPDEYTMGDGRFSEGLSESEYFLTAWAHYAWKYRDILYDNGDIPLNTTRSSHSFQGKAGRAHQ